MRQADLFESYKREPVSYAPDPQAIRERLNDMLDTARRASAMPWDERTARKYAIIFPQMANWLPPEEADALRAAFRAELARLKAASPP